MIPNLKTIIKFIVYYFINLLLSPSKEIKQNSLLLIRLDAIGDYILFRNFIKELKENHKYKDYKITLLGNSLWKSLAEELDSEFIDSFIWLDRGKFTKDVRYRFKKLNEITSHGYEIVLSPAYSREFFLGDAIVKLVHSNEKIGSSGDLSNIKKWQKKIGDKYYDRSIQADEMIMFEFYRNKEFFESFLDVKLSIHKPQISLKPKKLKFALPKKYAILFIGGSNSFRRWNIESFAMIGEYLSENYGYEIVLCGGPGDSESTMEFGKFFEGRYKNLVDKTSLLDFLHVISRGSMMVANETSAPHFAVALGMTNVFVIYNGKHYGRFIPYPKEVTDNHHVICHPKIEQDVNDYKRLSNSYRFDCNLDIQEVDVESLKLKISLNHVL
tara:strand:- start:3351 stop:4502 length:1152 start_codon:yes stop_codon:yes gene_type:complete